MPKGRALKSPPCQGKMQTDGNLHVLQFHRRSLVVEEEFPSQTECGGKGEGEERSCRRLPRWLVLSLGEARDSLCESLQMCEPVWVSSWSQCDTRMTTSEAVDGGCASLIQARIQDSASGLQLNLVFYTDPCSSLRFSSYSPSSYIG